jgi:hypothetical protein
MAANMKLKLVLLATAIATLSLGAGVAQSRPPTHSSAEVPYCPYGKKADGTCWVRCKYVICL